MPRYTYSPQGTLVRAVTLPASATAVDFEQPLGRAPFDGYVSLVQLELAAAYTGANTNYRAWRIRNKFGGTGVTQMAAIEGVSGTNVAALTPTSFTLTSSVPAAPSYSTQPTPTPTTAPVLSNGTGSLTAGLYVVAYSFVVNGVEGPLSPYASIVQGGSNGIAVAALTNVPPGVTSVRYYFVVSPGTAGFVVAGTGAAVTLNAQGNGTNATGWSAMDVTQGDLITCLSIHVGTGLADPGGTVEITFTRS